MVHFLSEHEMKIGDRFVLYGRSETGKTTEAVKLIAKYKLKIPALRAVIVSNHAEHDKVWIRATREFHRRTGQYLVNALHRQMTPDVALILKNILDYESSEETPYIIMFDDAGDDYRLNRTYKNNPYRQMGNSGNHSFCTTIGCYQSTSQTPTAMVTNAAYIISKKMLEPDLTELYRKYLQAIDRRVFDSLCMRAWKEDYDSLIIVRKGFRIKVYRNWDELLIEI